MSPIFVENKLCLIEYSSQDFSIFLRKIKSSKHYSILMFLKNFFIFISHGLMKTEFWHEQLDYYIVQNQAQLTEFMCICTHTYVLRKLVIDEDNFLYQ